MSDDCGCRYRPRPCGCACGGDWADGANPPGRDAVAYRHGSYATVFRRMRERLSAADLPGLRELTARSVDESVDPALALLDGWACLSHVLAFYNERAVNEAFLGTCTERRSALELARLVGYAPRPGVAADAYLAFTLEDVDPEAELEVPAGTRVYTQPGPGETMQPFETDEPLTGRPRWNMLRPRLTEPQLIVTDEPKEEVPSPQVIGKDGFAVWFRGLVTGLGPGSVLLFDVGDRTRRGLGVARVEPDTKLDRTRVEFQPRGPEQATGAGELTPEVLEQLLRRPTVHAPGPNELELKPEQIFGETSYAPLSLLGAAYPGLRANLGDALRGTRPEGGTGAVTVYAMRITAAVHGHNAPLYPHFSDSQRIEYCEWNLQGTGPALPTKVPVIDEKPVPTTEPDPEAEDGGAVVRAEARTPPPLPVAELGADQIALDAVYEGIRPDSLVAIRRPWRKDPAKPLLFAQDDVFTVKGVQTVSRAAFNIPARVTVLTLNRPWRPEPDPEKPMNFDLLRGVVVHALSEPLELAERPSPENEVCGGRIVLDGYYPGLHPGRRLVVTGERSDLGDGNKDGQKDEKAEPAAIRGVTASELVMVSGVEHRAPTESRWATQEQVHTHVTLAEPLQYCYARGTVTIHGNVAHATHGESRAEVLGSGDAARALQVFPLKQPPLTYVPAATPTGIRSTLEVQVNDLRWHEAPHPAAVAPGDREYVLRTDDDGATSVLAGLGARLPTGRDNVRAVYRSGLGAVGNVRPGQISVLASRPNGVAAVTNPLAATGGTDRDGLDQIRGRAPVGLSALDRLVSPGDFADFARAFAGIGKAVVSCTRREKDAEPEAVPCAGGQATELTLTVAGEDDAPLDRGSALLGNLEDALVRYGDLVEEKDGNGNPVLRTRTDPKVTVTVAVRDALLIGLRAQIRLQPDFLWEAVLHRLRTALVARFGFPAREIGRPLDPGAVIATMQGVRGVDVVDLQRFGTIRISVGGRPLAPAAVAEAAHKLLGDEEVPGMPDVVGLGPSEIAYLSPAAAGTLLLNPWKDTGS